MRKRRRIIRRKCKRIASRCVIVLTLIGMLVLMVCGVLFLVDLFTEEDMKQASTKNEGVERENEYKEEFNQGSKGEQQEESLKFQEIREPLPDGSGYTVILDAGHGGKDVGTSIEEAYDTVFEKDINLQVVLKLKEKLEMMGAHVVLLRESDKDLSLEERVGIGNESGGDLFVSIHCNYFEEDATIQGLECYHHNSAKDAQVYAERILQEVKRWGNVKTRNVKAEDFYVLRETNIPAVLIELGYLSNLDESKKLQDESYQGELAKELAIGILKSLKI